VQHRPARTPFYCSPFGCTPYIRYKSSLRVVHTISVCLTSSPRSNVNLLLLLRFATFIPTSTIELPQLKSFNLVGRSRNWGRALTKALNTQALCFMRISNSVNPDFSERGLRQFVSELAAGTNSPPLRTLSVHVGTMGLKGSQS